MENLDFGTRPASGITPETQAALDTKAPIASPTFTGTVSGITAAMVGLGSVNNTSDADKPVSTAQQTALDAKANLASPTFTGTVGGITKAMVGLGNVDNTSDVGKPVSTAQQTALDAKAPLAAPTFTGLITANGGQIKFPAAQLASADVNTLDDYEEGTFVPGISFGGAAVDLTYSTQVASYTKIGRLVFVRGRITMTAKGTSVGAAKITGLPFAATSNASMSVGEAGAFTSLTGALTLLSDVATTIAIEQSSATGTALVTDAAFTNTTTIFFSGCYES